MTLNKVHLVGHAGMDPKVRYFESGKMVCNLTLAVSRNTSKRDEPPDWFDLEIWNKPAEIAASYVKKGKLIGVLGSLKLSNWTDDAGNQRQKTVIVVESLELLGSRKDNEAASSSSNSTYDDDF
jgi:single-strand DNA-binding protein